jgi:hypothetical protein
LPRQRLAERFWTTLERIGEKKGVRLRDVGVGGVSRDESGVGLSSRDPRPGQSVGDSRFVDAARLCERTHDEVVRDTDPELAGDHLVEHKPLDTIHLAPRA